MTRHRLLAILVALLAVNGLAVAPVAAQTSLFGSSDTGPEIQTYDGHPSFIVDLENSSTSAASVEDWTNSSADRQLISLDNDSNQAVVSASRVEVLAQRIVDLGVTSLTINTPTALTDALRTRSYVEDIHINYRIERVEPVQTPLEESEFEPPTQGVTRIGDDPFPTDGLAFSGDVNTTHMNVSRDAVGIDETSATGNGTTVAVIDTGANTAGPGQIFGNGSVNSSVRIDNDSKSFITNASVDVPAQNFSAIEDGNGHGTWVASAIAANTTDSTYDGMAPDADLLVLKALADDGSGSMADISDAVRYAADNGADIISMSLGSPLYTEPLVDALDYAHNQSNVNAIVVAAGNSRPTRSPGIASPGDYGPVITVGATNGSEPGTAWSAYFSQTGPDTGAADRSGLESRGAQVDVAAPGFEITAKTATTSGFLNNDTLSGTSMATPIVAGVLATTFESNSTLADANHSTVHDAVTRAAEPVPHAATVEVGDGMVNAPNLIDGTRNDTSQNDAMLTGAKQRDAYYRAFEPEGLFSGIIGVAGA